MSLPTKALVTLLHLRPKPLASAEAIAAEVAHDRVDADVPSSLERSHDIVRSVVDGMPVLTLSPKGSAPTGELLYLHGGAYVHPLIDLHWQIIEHLAAETPVRVTVPLYPLAPEHTCEETFPALHAVYDGLASSGLPLVVAGDSAGGTLAVASVLRARDEGLGSPAAVLLFAPWVDARMTNPAIADIEAHDPVLGRAGLVWAAQKWAGGRPLTDPWLSPLTDTLAGLPPLAVFQGGVDIFAPDVQLFAEKAAAAGTPVELHLYPDAFHVFVAVPQLPEAKEALARAQEIIASAAAGPAA